MCRFEEVSSSPSAIEINLDGITPVAEFKSLDWLKKIRLDYERYPLGYGRYPLFALPCVISHGRLPAIFATDGSMFVAIMLKNSPGLKINEEASKAAALVMDKLLYSDPHRFRLLDIKDWAGIADWGTWVCDGEYLPVRPKYGYLCGILIDKVLIARALEGIESPSIVEVCVTSETTQLYMRGDGWIIGIMPVYAPWLPDAVFPDTIPTFQGKEVDQ